LQTVHLQGGEVSHQFSADVNPHGGGCRGTVLNVSGIALAPVF